MKKILIGLMLISLLVTAAINAIKNYNQDVLLNEIAKNTEVVKERQKAVIHDVEILIKKHPEIAKECDIIEKDKK
jgi:hypothetical protein